MSKKYFFVLMQNEVKKVKIVGIEPKKYFSKKQQRDVTGFSLYFDQESEHVYGLAVKEEWVSNEVYADFISLFDGDPHKALGEQVKCFITDIGASQKSCHAPDTVGCPDSSYTCEVCEYWGKEDDT